jgi:hypothetical protein
MKINHPCQRREFRWQYMTSHNNELPSVFSTRPKGGKKAQGTSSAPLYVPLINVTAVQVN